MSLDEASVADNYFNDLSRQPNIGSSSLDIQFNSNQSALPEDTIRTSKPKRIACVVCRKRKLKCDGGKPSCASCSRLGHSCAYDEIRRKSGPKRGYVKELEARLAQVEIQLKTKAQKKTNANESGTVRGKASERALPSPPNFTAPALNSHDTLPGITSTSLQGPMEAFNENTWNANNKGNNMSSTENLMPDLNTHGGTSAAWDMIALGLEEPLPTQEAIDELHEAYFEYIHPSVPMLHKYRYHAAMNLAPNMRPPVCLRYAMWCLAASVDTKYFNHQEILYRRARKYAELDEMKGQGETFVSIGHTQCWILIASYEFKMMYFPRAWMSVGKASRLALMLALNKLDGSGLDVKKSIPPPRDWTEGEERRRTFWMAYCIDRYASIGTGWPLTLDERDIMTNLPASEEAYEKCIPQQTLPLNESMTPQEAADLSSFGGVVFMAHFFGLNLTHLHRPDPNDQEHNLQGEFWKRHRKMDNIMLNIALSLPPHLRLPAGVREPNVVFLNMGVHATTICLHQAAIFKAESNSLPSIMIEQSRTRCLLAAAEIAATMRLVCHIDTAMMNPFTAFCLYVAARVFVHRLKKAPEEQEIRASLEFLLNAMHVFKRRNPLSESFLIQLSLEAQGTGLDTILHSADLSPSLMKAMTDVSTENVGGRCSALYEFRDRNGVAPGGQNYDNIREQGKELLGVFPKVSAENRASNVNSSANPHVLQTMNLPAREQRPPQPLWSHSQEELVSLDSILNNGDWVADSPTNLNYSLSNTTFDTNMSDNLTDELTSTGQTPSTDHSSSNTSYPSPQNESGDNSQKKSQNSSLGSAGVARGEATSSIYTLNTVDESRRSSTRSPEKQELDVTSNVNHGWQLRSPDFAGELANPIRPAHGDWAQMLEGVLWNEGAMGIPNMEPWGGQQGPVN